MSATRTQPTTPAANQDLYLARTNIQVCNRCLRAAKRLTTAEQSTPGMESLHTAIDALSVAVEALARIVEGGQR